MKLHTYHNGDDVFIAWKPEGAIDNCRGGRSPDSRSRWFWSHVVIGSSVSRSRSPRGGGCGRIGHLNVRRPQNQPTNPNPKPVRPAHQTHARSGFSTSSRETADIDAAMKEDRTHHS
jgi:hypothetical protein